MGNFGSLNSLQIKRKGGGGERRKESIPPAWKGVQVYYDGSGRPEPPVGGAGFAIFKEGVEVAAGAETIPFGTNNVGEFKGALIGLRQASKLTERVEVIGDCMILTNAAANDKNVKEVELDNILDKIKTTAGKMKEAKFTHVFREHNKMAIASKDWNPCAQKLGETDEEWIVLNSERWKRINTGSKKKSAFPVPSGCRIRKKGSKVLQSDLAIFPKMNIPEGTTASKGVVLYNITRWSKEGPLVSKRGEGEEIIVQRMEELGRKIGFKLSTLAEPSHKPRQLEDSFFLWTGKEMKSKAYQRRSIMTVRAGKASFELSQGPVWGKFNWKNFVELKVKDERVGGEVVGGEGRGRGRKKRANGRQEDGKPKKRARKEDSKEEKEEKEGERGKKRNTSLLKWFQKPEKRREVEDFHENDKGVT